MSNFLSLIDKPEKVNNKTFVKVDEIRFQDLTYYLTDKGRTDIKYSVSKDNKIPYSLNLDDYDIYTSVGEMALCFRGVTSTNPKFTNIIVEDYYNVELLNDFKDIEETDVILVTDKRTDTLIGRGRYFSSKFNTTEIAWACDDTIDFFEFLDVMCNFYKLVGIK
ncbi:hypothetical protein [Paraclostridium bifermentans]|uniref:hypothetical protein n=1 Tax=Paraclostridium bifermentans TaxID=1490 RepID=UPI00374E36A8